MDANLYHFFLILAVFDQSLLTLWINYKSFLIFTKRLKGFYNLSYTCRLIDWVLTVYTVDE